MVGVNLFTEHSAQFCGANLASCPRSLLTLFLLHLVALMLVTGLEFSLLSSRLSEQGFTAVMQSYQLYKVFGALHFNLLAFEE